jgi:dUTP pyrophosphatase
MKVERIHPDAQLPARGTDQAAGLDLSIVESVTIKPGQSAILHTGIRVAITPGWVGLIWPRSKLGAKKRIQVLAGVVDSDYRGEVMIALLNSGEEPLEIRRGDKVAQLILQPVSLCDVVEVEHLDETGRGKRGINCSELRL